MSSALRVEKLSRDDAGAGLELSTEAGWNQLAADWSFLLANGQGLGIRADGRLVASSVALPYPPDFGWVSMILVTRSFRRRGLATLLLRAAADYLLARNLVPILDATPEGRLVYQRLGFRETEQINRWFRDGAGPQTPTVVRAGTRAKLDLAAFGADRDHLLKDFAARQGSFFLSTDAGHAVRRRGRLSSHIGPVVARTDEDALHLIRSTLSNSSGPLIIDVPSRLAVIGDDLSANGFSIQRQLFRMTFNGAHRFGDPSLNYAIAGPEFG